MDPSGVMRSSTGGSSSATRASTPPSRSRFAAYSPFTGRSWAMAMRGMGGKIMGRSVLYRLLPSSTVFYRPLPSSSSTARRERKEIAILGGHDRPAPPRLAAHRHRAARRRGDDGAHHPVARLRAARGGAAPAARVAACLRARRFREQPDRARAPGDRRAGRGDGAAPRLPGRHPGERLDLPLPHGGGGPGRPPAAAGDAAPLQPERPGPPRAVPPDRAAHPGREQGDARRDCPLALLRTAARAGATPNRERDARQRHARAAARRARAAGSGLRPREPPLAPVPLLSLGDGRAIPAAPPAQRHESVLPAAPT